MRTLCRVHPRRGPDYGVGLGFYAFLRFHVDTTKYRRWGADPDSTMCPPIIRPADVASVYQPPQPVVVAPSPTPAPTPNPNQVPAADPLAPTPSVTPPSEPSPPLKH